MNKKVITPRDYLRKLTNRNAAREIGKEEVATYIAREIMPYAERRANCGISHLDHVFETTINSDFQIKIVNELRERGFDIRYKLSAPHEFPQRDGVRLSW